MQESLRIQQTTALAVLPLIVAMSRYVVAQRLLVLTSRCEEQFQLFLGYCQYIPAGRYAAGNLLILSMSNTTDIFLSSQLEEPCSLCLELASYRLTLLCVLQI